jgi:type I protein arginine methyltransferase
MSLIVDEHRHYLTDAVRVERFRQALTRALRPGMTVADIGSGTGVFGLLALAAGAARVHSIEATGMIEIARAVAAANGFQDRFHAHQSELRDVRLPERVDLCVGDFIGRFGFDAGAFETYPLCTARLLTDGGTLIPSAFSMFVAPVERADLAADAHFWTERRHGFDFSPVSEWAVNTGYPAHLSAGDLLGAPACIGRLPAGELPPAGGIRREVDLQIDRPGTLHGLGGWCSAELVPGVEMTNSPLSADRIARRNVFLPLSSAVGVAAGDIVRARVSILPLEVMVTWAVEVRGPGGLRQPRQTHSTLRGMLLSRAMLRRSRPDATPGLSPRGFARLTTLQLCAERRPLREIEGGVWERHRELFASRDEAAGFVAEVVSCYAAD